MNNYMDKKEEVYEWLPEVEQIAPGKVFGKGEGSAQKMNVMIGIGVKAALNNLARLKEEDRAHIHAWTRTSTPSPVWVKGPGEDAPKPKARLAPEIARQRAELKTARAKEKHDAQLIGQGRAISHGTIERAVAAGPRSPFAHLFDLAGES